MKDLKTITNLVKHILETEPQSRNSDSVLYIKVCKKINPIICGLPFETVMLNRKDFGIPNLETVGRCRRKIVEQNPSLAGNATVEAGRGLKEEVFREYGRQVVG